jgi:hypothetical protein
MAGAHADASHAAHSAAAMTLVLFIEILFGWNDAS